MKTNKYIYSLLTSLVLLLGISACSPDDYSLGSVDKTSEELTEGLAYTIEKDASNPNIVYLKSLLPDNYQILWDHPQGRAQGKEVTLKLPFEGDYNVRMGVETRGGVVYGPVATFNINTFCADFVNDELWTMLTGGVGSSKTWYLDLDEQERCRYFVGPLYFYGTNDSWASVTLGESVGGDSWSWGADWAGQKSWLFGDTGAIDFGSMTFSLQGGANITVVDNAHGRTMNGTFQMDVDNHTMKITDAEILHDPGRDAIVTQWGNITILALDENHMQLAVLRDNSDEGPCLLSYNFISEQFRDDFDNNVVPETPSISLIDGWRDYVEPKTQKQMVFKLSADELPYDWCDLYGAPKGVTSEALEDIGDLTLSFNRTDGTYTCEAPDGSSTTGTFTLSDDGTYYFENGLPTATLSTDGLAQFKANSDNTLKVLAVTVDDYSGGISDLWLGSDDVNDQGETYQYRGYHFKPYVAGGGETVRYKATLSYFDTGWAFQYSEDVYVTGDGDYTFTINGASGEPYGMFLDIAKLYKDHNNCDIVVKSIKVDGNSVDFDDAAIDRGTADGDLSTARRYILNPWGATAGDAPKYVFNSTLEVTVHVTFDCGSNVMNPEQ